MMHKLILLLIPIMALLAAQNLNLPDEFTIGGTVTDESGEALIGAAVLIKGTTDGTTTDLKGRFSLISPDASVTLVISYTGFRTVEVNAVSGIEVEIILNDDGMELSEVVVTALNFETVKASKGISAKSRKEKRKRPSAEVDYADDSVKSGEAAFEPASFRDIASAEIAEGGIYVSKKRERAAMTIKRDPAAAETGMHIMPEASFLIKMPDTEEKSFIKGLYEDGEAVPVVSGEMEVFDEPLTIKEEKLSAGQLTAAEWSDLQNWNDWKTTVEEDLASMESIWKINPGQRYAVAVKNEKGVPLPNTTVILSDETGAEIWKTKSDNTGRAVLWYDQNNGKSASTGKPQKIVVQYKGIAATLNKIISFEQGTNEITINASCPDFQKTEILFVVDATGSMGDEIRYLQAELGDVIERVKNLDFIDELNTGAVFYRDEGDEYVIRTQNLSADTDATLSFIDRQNANGGGDGPEAVETAMEEAIMKQNWSADAAARIAFVLLDAPPHQTEEIKMKMKSLTKKAAEKGIRIVPVLASGSQSSCEYLMRAMALTTNSRFLFLTDDSGIGNAHSEPSVGAYNVVFLNDLIFRLIVEYTAYDSCEEQAVQSPIVQATGAEDSFKASCYPLPANEYVFVNLEKDVDKLEIMDMQGQLLITKSSLSQGISTVFIDNLPPGTYIFKFIKEKEIQTVKVIKSGV